MCCRPIFFFPKQVEPVLSLSHTWRGKGKSVFLQSLMDSESHSVHSQCGHGHSVLLEQAIAKLKGNRSLPVCVLPVSNLG